MNDAVKYIIRTGINGQVYKKRDLTGMKFGRLTIIGPAPDRKMPCGRSAPRWRCECSCTPGKHFEISLSSLAVGTKGCRCSIKEAAIKTHKRHGFSKTNLYHAWFGIKVRCLKKTSPQYPEYGGRGISICDRWLKFENFYADMGPRPSPEMSIDRIDNAKGYCPENCRWATQGQQMRNTRRNRILEIDGIKKCMRDWSFEVGMSYWKLRTRIRNGWSAKAAVFDKSKRNARRYAY